MIQSISFKNFRGFRTGQIEIAPLTILTGANNSGKSTIMYAPLVLRALTTNANQPLDSFFNFTFMNLGGFKESVFGKDDDRRHMTLAVGCTTAGIESTYRAELGKSRSRLAIELAQPAPLQLAVDATFPYALNASTGADLDGLKATWNGLTAAVSQATVTTPEALADSSQSPAKKLQDALALPANDLKAVDFVALKRGFTKPMYSAVPLQTQLLTEDEIATFIANDRNLEGLVSHYLEKIVNRSFQVRPLLGSASFYLQTTDRETGFVCDLVNDGFGTNELVYLLAKALRGQQSLVCIEEPEIHVHPGALVKLARVLHEIAKNQERGFLISTHSEHFVVEILNLVARGELAPEDVRLYYLRREGKEFAIERQEVNAQGQLEGGLRSFYGVELAQIEAFLDSGK